MSAPVLTGAAAAIVALAAATLTATASLEAVQRAGGAADAAALAAADALSGWASGEPCALAEAAAGAVGARVDSCDLDPASGQVRVRVSLQTVFGAASARAHAGPALP